MTTLMIVLAAAESGGGGLPQLNTGDFAPQLVWLAITFTVLYFIMARVALPRVGEVIEERRDRIQRDIDVAEQLKSETEEALTAYEQALADARSNANSIANETRDKLTKEVDLERQRVESDLASKLSEAEASIAETKVKALESVNEIANDTVGDIIDKLIGVNVADADIKAAITKIQSR